MLSYCLQPCSKCSCRLPLLQVRRRRLSQTKPPATPSFTHRISDPGQEPTNQFNPGINRSACYAVKKPNAHETQPLSIQRIYWPQRRAQQCIPHTFTRTSHDRVVFQAIFQQTSHHLKSQSLHIVLQTALPRRNRRSCQRTSHHPKLTWSSALRRNPRSKRIFRPRRIHPFRCTCFRSK